MGAPHGRWISVWSERLMAIAQECCKLYRTSSGGSIPQSNRCTDTNHPLITKTIKIRRARYARFCQRSRCELKSDLLQLTSSHGRARVGRPAKTYPQQFCIDTRCSTEDQTKVMDDRDEWWKRVRKILASGTPWWWGGGFVSRIVTVINICLQGIIIIRNIQCSYQ